MNCAESRHRFDDLLDGDLPPAVRRLVEAHLARCPSCAAEFESLRRAVEGLRGATLLRAPSGLERTVLVRIRANRSRSSRRRRAAAIAGATLAASSLVFLRSHGGSGLGAEEPRAAASPASSPLARTFSEGAGPATVEASRAPGSEIPWNELAREGLRLVANAADLAARLRAAAPPASEGSTEEVPKPEETDLAGGPPEPARREAPFPVPSLVAAAPGPAVPPSVLPANEDPPFGENAAVVREGDRVLLRTSGPPDREIPALLGILRDEGGEASDLARSRLASIAADLSAGGVAPVPPREETGRPLRRMRALFADAEAEDPRAESFARWETWWERNRSSIARLAREGS